MPKFDRLIRSPSRRHSLLALGLLGSRFFMPAPRLLEQIHAVGWGLG